uniref:Uncharacterized protein n=1 Tax=Helianthus annuus TaxID=4232 RepID=A0A251U808_HELAN
MMGTELIRHHVKEESIDIPLIPPGFESIAAFSLKRADDNKVGSSCYVSSSTSEPQLVKKELKVEPNDDEKTKRSVESSCSVFANAFEPQPVKKESRVEPNDDEKTKRSVRPRPGINYGRFDGSSGDESESEQLDLTY